VLQHQIVWGWVENQSLHTGILTLLRHLSAKPGNVREFDSCQGMSGILLKFREMSGKKSQQGKVA